MSKLLELQKLEAVVAAEEIGLSTSSIACGGSEAEVSTCSIAC